MFFGVSALQTFHVIISVVGIATGLIVLLGLIQSQRMHTMTAVFLAATIITSASGFVFTFNGFTPAIALGVISLIALAIALFAIYLRGLQGPWRGVYVITAVLSLYLNTLVLFVQLFQKVPALHSLAPNGNELPFVMLQGIVLIFFVVTGWLAFRRFHPGVALPAGQLRGQIL